MNVALSGIFASVVLWGLDFIDVMTFTWTNVALLTGILVIVTHMVIMR